MDLAVIPTSDAKKTTGRFLIGDTLLAQKSITDSDYYSTTPGSKNFKWTSSWTESPSGRGRQTCHGIQLFGLPKSLLSMTQYRSPPDIIT
jgi:hypothetical protein